MNKAILPQPFTRTRKDDLIFFPLDGLLPAHQALVVNTDSLIISLVSTNWSHDNPILLQKNLKELQMRLLFCLLQSPHYCPHEILIASYSCSYQVLLTNLFSSDKMDQEAWLVAVQKAHLHLEQAQEQGTWRKEMKQIYNAISSLRLALRPFGIGITTCTTGSAYALIWLPIAGRRLLT